MCGIAGIIDCNLVRVPCRQQLTSMADAIAHRGPDEEGYFFRPGIGLAARRLSIVGIENGKQPVFNEDESVVAVYNGEIFEHQEIRRNLQAAGHRFRTDSDSELLVHLWEEYGERMFEHLNGQFAFALYDIRKRVLILARDRVGICPLHWILQNGRLFFGSEIKALLASGEIQAEPDIRGIDQILTMFALPSRRTMFRNIKAVYPGHYLKVTFRNGNEVPEITERAYWDLSFPDRGDEFRPSDRNELVSGLREVLFDSVRRRLRADVPVAAYLSGGIDSAVICATATEILDDPIHAFSIKIDSPFFDEETAARRNALAIGCRHTVVTCDSQNLLDRYQRLVMSAESPVVDTSCAALHVLSETVADHGYKVTLTGEGADEGLAGYPWFKTNKLLNMFDVGPIQPSKMTRWAIARTATPYLLERDRKRILSLLGGPVAQADFYGLVSSGRRRFLSKESQDELGDYCAFEELELNHASMKRWHPLNRSLYVGYKTQLSGMLLSQKSDRVAMANSVEARYPFLDEKVMDYCATIPPEWKLRGILRDKYVLRQMARGILPDDVALRPKKMFRAPFSDTIFAPEKRFVQELLSEESIRRTGYFCPTAVQSALQRRAQSSRWPSVMRCFEEMSLVAIFATQLWHHTFIDHSLCDLTIPSDRFLRTDQATNVLQQSNGRPRAERIGDSAKPKGASRAPLS